MALPIPVLDDRTFEQLVDEARARIPRFTPEWTNFNDSDPGMTLVKLHAWMTETILYRLNQLPDLNYLKFLELLNVQPRPAAAARAQLTFKLKKLNGVTDPLVILVPLGTQVGVDDPDLTEELIFETDRTLVALNAAIAAIVVPAAGATPLNPLALVTEFDADSGQTAIPRPFFAFGDAPNTASGDPAMRFGLMLRPQRRANTDYSLDRFPEGELDLTVLVPDVFEPDATGAEIVGPNTMECLFPWQVEAESETLLWEAYRGSEHATDFGDNGSWQKLAVVDETAALSRSGHVFLDVPGGLPIVPFSTLSRSLWVELGLQKPPASKQELIDDLNDGLFAPDELDEDVWEALGVSNPTLDNLAVLITEIQAATLTFGAVEADIWLDLGYDAPPAPEGLVWFRARLVANVDEPPQISQLLLNTVGATAAVTRIEEIIGTSDGRPNQTHRLRRAPVLVDEATGQPDLVIELEELDQPEAWQPVSDFFGKGPDAAVFRFDPPTGTLTFGDGQHGRIPVAGAEIVARRYRFGGGAVGNAGPGTITALRSALPDVDSVSNVRAAAGGSDAEPLAETRLRAPHDLRMRGRAVTGDDFADLAKQTPGVRIQRAFALPLTRMDFATDPPTPVPDTPGAVTVVILPENKEETPQPTEEQLRLVCTYLNERRLITTELYVVGPRYLKIGALTLEVTITRGSDIKTVNDAIIARLLDYFHPLRGGEDGKGWPFGEDVFFGNVYRQVLTIPGVLRVVCLDIAPTSGAEACDDVLAVPDGWLVHLPKTAIDLKVRYDRFG